MRSGELDRRITILRSTRTRDGFSSVPGAVAPAFSLWARKRVLGATEQLAAEQQGATVDAKFVVRWSAAALGISPRDQLVSDGVTYEISGTREDGYHGRRVAIEISAKAIA